MKTKKILSMLLRTAMLFTFSCSKEGPQGPAGRQGEQGIQGVAGSDGAKGDKGDRGATGPRGATGAKGDRGPTGLKGTTGPRGATGTANMIYSDWLEIQLTYGGIPDYYYCEIYVPKLSQDIVDKGEVRMYFFTGAQYYSIPNGDYPGLNYKFWTHHILLTSDDNYFDITYSYYYRYVLIPGGVHARLAGGQARTTSAPPDLNDYQAVCRYYGIPE